MNDEVNERWLAMSVEFILNGTLGILDVRVESADNQNNRMATQKS